MPDWAPPTGRAQQIHDYWFGPSNDWLQVIENNRRRWFINGQALDAEIRLRFRDSLDLARRGEFDDWQHSITGALARILLLDQFPRHMFRGRGEAFACDAQARKACLQGLEASVDEAMSPVQQDFFYLPLQHSEDLSLQDRSVALMEQRTREAPEEFKTYMRNSLKYACSHREIIQRFGRYPHRNQALGRASTREEIDYLDAGATRFGQ